jgi:hypothetical protein
LKNLVNKFQASIQKPVSPFWPFDKPQTTSSHEKAKEQLLDAAVEMSFPASDPVAVCWGEVEITRGPDISDAHTDHQNVGRVSPL